jgi:tetratricopeptide (TPR) repeat protein
LNNLGSALLAEKKPQDAAPYFRKAHGLQPNLPDVLENYALALEESGQTNEAIAAYHKLTLQHPNEPGPWARIGHLYYSSKRYQQASDAFQKSLTLDEKQPDAALFLGLSQMELGKTADAISSFEKCLAQRPTDFHALASLAHAYYSQKDYGKAADYYQKALAQKADDPDALTGLGASQLAANKSEEAIATYQKLVPLRPDDPNIRFNLGTAQFNKGLYQDSAASYREAIRLKPDFAHAHYNLGMALSRLNETKAAQVEFSEAQRLDPSLKPPTANTK